KMLRRVLVLALCLGACGKSSKDPEQARPASTDTADPSGVVACLAGDDNCYGREDECCSGSFCRSGVSSSFLYGLLCMPPLPAGEYCTADEQCQSGTCVDSACATNGAVGDPCDTNEQCQSGSCVAFACEPSDCAPDGGQCDMTYQ